MKKTLTILILIMFAYTGYGQTGKVGVNTTDPKATLDIQPKAGLSPADAKGILIPRLSGDAIKAMRGMENSTLVYANSAATAASSTTAVNITAPGYYYYDSVKTKWVAVGAGAAKAIEPWKKFNTVEGATSREDSIYTFGSVAIGLASANETPAGNAKLDVNGAIVAGKNRAIEGSVLLRERYSNGGFLASFGVPRSAGGPGMFFAVKPSKTEPVGYESSIDGSAIGRGAFTVNGRGLVFRANDTLKTIAANDPVVMKEKFKIQLNGKMVSQGVKSTIMPKLSPKNVVMVTDTTTGLIGIDTLADITPNEWVKTGTDTVGLLQSIDAEGRPSIFYRKNGDHNRYEYTSTGELQPYSYVNVEGKEVKWPPAPAAPGYVRPDNYGRIINMNSSALYDNHSVVGGSSHNLVVNESRRMNTILGRGNRVINLPYNRDTITAQYGYQNQSIHAGSGVVEYLVGGLNRASVLADGKSSGYVHGSANQAIINTTDTVQRARATFSNVLFSRGSKAVVLEVNGHWSYAQFVHDGTTPKVNRLKLHASRLHSYANAVANINSAYGYYDHGLEAADVGDSKVASYFGLFVEDITAATNNFAIYTKKGFNSLGDTLQVRNIASTIGNLATDSLVLATPQGVLRTKSVASLAPIAQAAAQSIEPWYKKGTTTGATSNIDTVYTMGYVGIGTNDPKGSLHINTNNTTFGDDVVFKHNTASNITVGIGKNPSTLSPFHSLETERPITVSGANSHLSIFETDIVDNTRTYFERNNGISHLGANDGTTSRTIISYSDAGNVGINTFTPKGTFHVDIDKDGEDRDDIIMTSHGGQARLSIGVPVADLKPWFALQTTNRAEISATNRHLQLIEADGTVANSYSYFERNVDKTSFGAHRNGTSKIALTYLDDGNVGIGTTNPTQKLEINGAIKIGDTTTGSTPALGTIRYHNDKFEGYTSTGWVPLH